MTPVDEELAAECREYAKAMADQRYDVLDKTYMDLVLLRVQYSDFNETKSLYAENIYEKKVDSKRRYESYAFALFNYLSWTLTSAIWTQKSYN